LKVATAAPILDTVIEPSLFVIAAESRVRYWRVEADPNARSERLEVVREFEAVSQTVLILEGIVAETPMSCKPFGVFRIDW
jgi:hypothetical protein